MNERVIDDGKVYFSDLLVPGGCGVRFVAQSVVSLPLENGRAPTEVADFIDAPSLSDDKPA